MPDPQIRLRILTNPKTSDSARVETTKIAGTNSPEYNQEFALKVPDAHNAQLGEPPGTPHTPLPFFIFLQAFL
jgi:hypothetical protein